MTSYYVTLHYTKEGAKTVDSIVKARELAYFLMQKSNGRFVYAEIYTGKNRYPKEPKYRMMTPGQYSRPRDGISAYGYLDLFDAKGKLVGYVFADGHIKMRR